MSEIDDYYYLQYAMIEERGKENPEIVKSFNELKQKLESTLKLKELVKKEISSAVTEMGITETKQDNPTYIVYTKLQSLVEESEK